MTIRDGSSDIVIEEGRAVSAGPERSGPLVEIAYVLGSAGLLIATAVDALAVAGRHSGFHLLGSIEIVQAAVVLIAASAMVAATALGTHASVHILTERLAKRTARRLARFSALLSALLFLIVSIGSIWVASDLWSGYEQTELLGIPLRWLRLLWIGASLLIAFLFARAFARGE